jgi:hypothetical protein
MTQRTRKAGWNRWCRRLVVPVAVVGIAGAALLWRRHVAWWSTPQAVAQNLGNAAPDLSDIPTAQGNGPGAHPFHEPPTKLLSQTEVEQGLAERHRALRQRFEAHEDRRSQEPHEDYSVPKLPSDVNVPPRPDTPDGEFHGGGDQ